MIDDVKRAGQYLCWAVATLLVVLTLSVAVLSGGDDAALRSHHGSPQATGRPLVTTSPAPAIKNP